MDLYDFALHATVGGLVFVITYLTVKYKADEAKSESEPSDERLHWIGGAIALVVIGFLVGVYDQVIEPQDLPRTAADFPRTAEDVFAITLGPYAEVAPIGAPLGLIVGLVMGLYERHKAGVL